eukprot:GHVN01082275.1.p1 GENE.GHVN01082275.1~~GHVN01082275.1.p1  ORF type:complete len:438 (-),score=29.93 GHVN01082275.1:59-1372(-)
MKLTWAKACKVRWPCKALVRNHVQNTCPLTFELNSESGLCEPPESLTGTCATPLDPSKLTDARMKALETECDFDFPRETPEVKFADTKCPIGWDLHKTDDNRQICTSGSYEGPCSSYVDVAKFTNTDKLGFAVRCGAMWPLVEDRECDVAYESRCPVGWRPHGASCVAPSTYVGKCSPRTSFNKYTVVMKQAWAHVCDAAWPCESMITDADKPVPTPAKLNKTSSSEDIFSGPLSLNGTVVDPNQSQDHHLADTQPQFRQLFGSPKSKSNAYDYTVEEMNKVLKQMRYPVTGTEWELLATELASQEDPLGDGKCTKDWVSKCPVGWDHFGDYCYAQTDYVQTPTCSAIRDFPGMTELEKKEEEKSCHVSFPCKQCEHDYVRTTCPLRWVEEEDGWYSSHHVYQKLQLHLGVEHQLTLFVMKALGAPTVCSLNTWHPN